MMPLLLSAVALVGLLVGSFLNVVVWRVPRGESVVSPRSRCPGCGTQIRPRDNVPVLSWVLLRGRCRDCDAPISARYPAVEVGTAAVLVVLTLRIGVDPALPAYLYLGAVGVALAMIDLDVKRLPDVIVLPSYAVCVVLFAVAALASGEWGSLLRALLGMAGLYGLYFLLAFAYPAGMGFGDVKLAGVLGLALGWLGWSEVVVGGFLGFLFGGVVGVVLMVAQRAGRKSQLPFGPFMLMGALVSVLWGGALGDLYLDRLPG